MSYHQEQCSKRDQRERLGNVVFEALEERRLFSAEPVCGFLCQVLTPGWAPGARPPETSIDEPSSPPPAEADEAGNANSRIRLDGQILHIRGTKKKDVIIIRDAGAKLNKLRVKIGDETAVFKRKQVQSIMIDGRGGKDRIKADFSSGPLRGRAIHVEQAKGRATFLVNGAADALNGLKIDLNGLQSVFSLKKLKWQRLKGSEAIAWAAMNIADGVVTAKAVVVPPGATQPPVNNEPGDPPGEDPNSEPPDGAGAAPAAPGGLAAAAISDSAINLNWKDNSTDEDGFVIERSRNGFTSVDAVIGVGPNVKSYQDTGLTEETVYSYRISAYNLLGAKSAHAGPASAKTLSPAPEEPPAPTIPTPPADVTVQQLATARMDLSWTNTSDDVDGFIIERSLDGTRFVVLGKVSGDVFRYTDYGISPGIIHHYRVKAYNSAGESGPSEWASLFASSAPLALTATALSDTEVELTWPHNPDNTVGYKILRSTDGIRFIQIATTLETRFVHTQLSEGRTASYIVSALGTAKSIAVRSPATNVTTLPTAPSELQATAVSESEIELMWNDNSAKEEQYTIERSRDGFATIEGIFFVEESETRYHDRDLVAGTTYSYRVRAISGRAGASYYSEPARATTQGVAPEPAPKPGEPPVGPEPEEPQLDYSRIISAFTGTSSGDLENRQVNETVLKVGWSGFVEKHIKPEIAWGVQRFLIHNPFGWLPGESYQFDQYIHAQEAGVTKATEGFVEAWKPITDSGIEVIGYLGKLQRDMDFLRAGDASFFDWDRFWRSVQPLLDAGMSVGFDAISDAQIDSHAFAALKALRDMGVKVYIEARPAYYLPHLHDFPVISTRRWWERSDPALHEDAARWAARNEQLTNEVLIWQDRPLDGFGWMDAGWTFPAVTEIIAGGHTAIFWVGKLIKEGYSIDQVLSPAA